jgi:plastocyanin
MILRRTRLLLTAVTTVMVWGLQAPMPLEAATATATATMIIAKDFVFMPTKLTVKAGSTVTWINMDDEPHTVVSDTGLFKSGGMNTNESFSFKFQKPGTYHFTCSIRPRMVGTVVVLSYR